MEKPLPQSAPGLLGVLGGIIVVGLIGVVFTLLVVCRQQQKPQTDGRKDTTGHPPARKQAPPPPKRRTNNSRSQPTREEIQSSGHRDYDVHYAELDTSALASSPSLRSSIQADGDLVDGTNGSLGKRFEDLPNTADYVSYRLACNKDDYLEPHSPPLQSPLTYLPQNAYVQPPSNTAVFRFPPPGCPAPYTFPKEQYV